MLPNLFTLKPFWRACIGALLIAASGAGSAAEQVFFSVGGDHLSKGYDSWANAQAGYAFRGAKGSGMFLVEEQWRFKRQDTAVTAAGELALSRDWAMQGEVYASTGEFLAKQGAYLGASKALPLMSGGKVVLDSGARWRAYDSFNQVSWSAGAQAYLAGWSFLYRLAVDVSDGELGSLYGHQVGITREFDDNRALALVFATGRERNMDQGVALAPQSVQAISLGGRFSVTEQVLLRPVLAVTKQGDSYVRTSLQVGLQYAF